MLKPISLFLLSLTAITFALDGDFVHDIHQCTPLTPRPRATSIHDLRADDIKVIAALGDSVTAALLAKPSTGLFGYLTSFNEFRGKSYSIGGDEGAITIPNLFKHYQPELMGYSKGIHGFQHCNYDDCSVPYNPILDSLNAAQSGAIVSSLDTELDYLIQTMQGMKIDFENDWKMINIQIGSNDMCQSCKSSNAPGKITPEQYGNYLENAIVRIQENIPNVLVNLVGSYNLTQLLDRVAGESYCGPPARAINLCPCHNTREDAKEMSETMQAYDEQMLNIFNKYQNVKNDSFAVVYQPHNVNFTSCPMEYWSNVDCFHASFTAHRFLAKTIWNEFFLPQSKKALLYQFDDEEPIYCPTDSDRISTN